MLRIVFMGSPDFAVPALEALIASPHEVVLVMTQPDKPAGRGKRVAAPSVKLVAERAGIPIVQPKSARKPEVGEALRETGADLGVVVAYGKILPRAVLDAFPHGCFNIHGSMLPRYRGAAPIQWALINGETRTGVTIMKLDEGMDTGPMLLAREIAIEPDDTSADLFERLAPLGAELLLEALSRLEAGTLTETPQDPALATYAPMLKKADGILDFSLPANAVRDRVRGVTPWPGATTTLNQEPLKLFGATVVDREGPAGTVLGFEAAGIIVGCGENACAFREVQAAGRKRVSAVDFSRGRTVSVGTILGD